MCCSLSFLWTTLGPSSPGDMFSQPSASSIYLGIIVSCVHHHRGLARVGWKYQNTWGPQLSGWDIPWWHFGMADSSNDIHLGLDSHIRTDVWLQLLCWWQLKWAVWACMGAGAKFIPLESAEMWDSSNCPSKRLCHVWSTQPLRPFQDCHYYILVIIHKN